MPTGRLFSIEWRSDGGIGVGVEGKDKDKRRLS
jgi:hypothetical protein